MSSIIEFFKNIFKFIGDNWITIFLCISIVVLISLIFFISDLYSEIKKASKLINAAGAAENEEYLDRLLNRREIEENVNNIQDHPDIF